MKTNASVFALEPTPPGLGAYGGFSRDEWVNQALRFWDRGPQAVYDTLIEVGLSPSEAREVVELASRQIEQTKQELTQPAQPDPVFSQPQARAPFLGYSIDEWVAQAMRYWDQGADAVISTLLEVGLSSAEALAVYERAAAMQPAPQAQAVAPRQPFLGYSAEDWIAQALRFWSTGPDAVKKTLIEIGLTPDEAALIVQRAAAQLQPIPVKPAAPTPDIVQPVPVTQEAPKMTQAEIDAAIAAVNPTVLANVLAELKRRLPDTPITQLDAAYWAGQGGVPAVRRAFPLPIDAIQPTGQTPTPTTGGGGLPLVLAAAAYFLLS